MNNALYLIERSLLAETDGMIVLGKTRIDVETETEFKQVELVAKTKGGWVSVKKIVLEEAQIIGYDGDFAIVAPTQAERLIEEYNKNNCKVWHQESEMDATTAFGLCGAKYGWGEDY